MTADERKQAEEYFLKKYPLYKDIKPNEVTFFREKFFEMLEEYASLKVAEATKEMYPSAFVEWKDNVVNVQYYAYGNTYYVREVNTHFVGLKLLFEYWKQNIQGK
jgi:hypothetical protein